MLSQLIRRWHELTDRPAIVDSRTAVSWSQWIALVEAWKKSLSNWRGSRIALSMQPSVQSYAALAALDELTCDAFLLDARLSVDESTALTQRLRVRALVRIIDSHAQHAAGGDPPIPDFEIVSQAKFDAGSGTSTVTILTSGTSGEPKAVRHTWISLSRPVRATPQEESPRWLLCYPPHLYAGLQVFLQCVVSGGVLVIDDSQGDVRSLIELMVRQRVGYISATPSYWRRIFMLADPKELARVPIVQVTLGGEVVDDGVLSKLAQVYPQARIVHIYATSELGRCFSVTDRKSGFPSRFLDQRSTDGVELRIAEGELLVRSENRMATYDSPTRDGVVVAQDGWTRTGDLVELRGDRVHFIGRMTDIINVGGNKVAPLEVERVIRSVPGVLDVRVYPKGSSIAGQLVACDVVPDANIDPNELRQRISQHCQSALAGHARPRWITIVDQIALTAANKVRRNNAAV